MTSTFAASLAANVYFGLFLLIAAFGFVLGFFTVRGSGINNHPSDGRNAAPGARLPDEFHQFAGRQLHDADLRRAAREQQIEAPATGEPPARRHVPHPHVPRLDNRAGGPEPVPADDPSLDEINRRLAAEAQARRAAKQEPSRRQ